MAVASVLGAVFVAVSAVFVNAWLAGVVCIVVASIVIQLFGVMAVLDIHLSAIPAVIVILAVGIGVEFTLHICIVSSFDFLRIFQTDIIDHIFQVHFMIINMILFSLLFRASSRVWAAVSTE